MGGEAGLESGQSTILEQDAIFFGQQEASASNIGNDTILALRIKDFADEKKNIQLRHPVCFECFGEILKQLE